MSNEMTARQSGNANSGRPQPATCASTSTKTPIRVLLVADIRLFREGLALVLRRYGRLTIVGTAKDREDALRGAREIAPDVILIDVATPESYRIAQDIRRILPRAHLVALGVPETEGDLLACAEAGIAGCVSRDGSPEDLVATIETTARGEVICPPDLVGPLWRRLGALAENQRPTAAAEVLTRREREIVRLIDFQLSNKEIARRLGIEVATVKNHVHNLLDKLHVATREQAAACTRAVLVRRPPESAF
jgi:DNA-binding NarL/FixJ family response regulator